MATFRVCWCWRDGRQEQQLSAAVVIAVYFCDGLIPVQSRHMPGELAGPSAPCHRRRYLGAEFGNFSFQIIRVFLTYIQLVIDNPNTAILNTHILTTPTPHIVVISLNPITTVLVTLCQRVTVIRATIGWYHPLIRVCNPHEELAAGNRVSVRAPSFTTIAFLMLQFGNPFLSASRSASSSRTTAGLAAAINAVFACCSLLNGSSYPDAVPPPSIFAIATIPSPLNSLEISASSPLLQSSYTDSHGPGVAAIAAAFSSLNLSIFISHLPYHAETRRSHHRRPCDTSVAGTHRQLPVKISALPVGRRRTLSSKDAGWT